MNLILVITFILNGWQEWVGLFFISRQILLGGVGNSTNNQVEVNVVLQGLLLVNESKTKTLIYIGDSSIIINLMISKKRRSNSKLASLIA
jgi:ribonuclease HI